jgi:putative tryptophan/tyrosine transport system substrate-binding protein
MSWSARWEVAGMFDLRRRNFIALVGGAAAWPLAARAQQPTVPVIGYLSQNTPEAGAALVAAVRKGLSEVGIVEGRDVTSEFRWARYDVDRLPALAADLVQHRVAVIITLGTPPAARAAKTATTEIPIVFALGTDPVQVGLVESLNHPAGNITGITTMNLDIAPKWVDLLHELLPTAKRFAVLVNIQSADSARAIITGTQAAGFALGMQIEILFASNESEVDAAFAGLGARAQALIIHSEVLFLQNLQKLGALAVREKLPALYSQRAFPEAGGLMSYGSSFLDAHRQVGIYAGRILKGEKPGELPVQRATKFELVLNLKTAKAIGLQVPATLLARADEVIE